MPSLQYGPFCSRCARTALVRIASRLCSRSSERLPSRYSSSVVYFKSLPTDARKHWAVCLLVLEKSDCRPKIYIGSGTNKNRGAVLRLQDYDRKGYLPQYVKCALDTATHSCPKDFFAGHLFQLLRRDCTSFLFLAIEATFSIVLWTMMSRPKTYGMPPLRPWSLDIMEYDGCCSHSALAENVTNEAGGLTLEQITATELEEKQRQSDAKKASYQEFKRLDFEGWQAKRREYAARARTPDPVKRAATAKKTKRKMKDIRRNACDICDVTFISSTELNIHNTTRKHIDKATGVNRVSNFPQKKRLTAANVAERKHYCGICDLACAT